MWSRAAHARPGDPERAGAGGPGASAGFRQSQEWGQAEGAAAPKGPPMCCCCRGAVACGADVCVAVRPAWGLPFFLSWRVRRQRRASKLRAANGYVRSGMCRSPPSEVLLTFQRHPRWSRRAAVSLGRSLRPSFGVTWWGPGLSAAPVVPPWSRSPHPHVCLVPAGVWGVARATSRVGAGVLTTRRCRGSPWRSKHWVEARVGRCLWSGSRGCRDEAAAVSSTDQEPFGGALSGGSPAGCCPEPGQARGG